MKTTIEYTGERMDDFPKIMIHRDDLLSNRSDPLIIRFFTPNDGVVICHRETHDKYYNLWYACDWDIKHFVPFKGKIVIEA